MWLRSCAVRQILLKVLSKFANEARQGIGSFEKTTKCTATPRAAMHWRVLEIPTDQVDLLGPESADGWGL